MHVCIAYNRKLNNTFKFRINIYHCIYIKYHCFFNTARYFTDNLFNHLDATQFVLIVCT